MVLYILHLNKLISETGYYIACCSKQGVFSLSCVIGEENTVFRRDEIICVALSRRGVKVGAIGTISGKIE